LKSREFRTAWTFLFRETAADCGVELNENLFAIGESNLSKQSDNAATKIGESVIKTPLKSETMYTFSNNIYYSI
jgi:hypothetical protein